MFSDPKPLSEIADDLENELGCTVDWVESSLVVGCSQERYDEEVADEFERYREMGYQVVPANEFVWANIEFGHDVVVAINSPE